MRRLSHREKLYAAGVGICALACCSRAPAAWSVGLLRDAWPAAGLRAHQTSSARAAPIPRYLRVRSRQARRLSARAAQADLETGLFDLTMRMNEMIGASLDGGSPVLLLPALFTAGIVSSVNPCSAAALPAAVASVTALGQDRAGVVGQAIAFAVGSGTVLACLALGASAVGGQPFLAEGLFRWVFPCIAVLMGLNLLGLMPLGLFSLNAPPRLPSGIPRELQGFCLGAFAAVGSSPCATPVLVTVVSYLAMHPVEPIVSVALVLSYSLGYTAPLALGAAFAGVLPALQRNSRFSPLLAGAAILAVGTAQLITLGGELMPGRVPPGTLGGAAAVAALVAFTLATLAGREQNGSRGASFEVAPVPGEKGVYRYLPATNVPTSSKRDFADPAQDARRAALAAICFGSSAVTAQEIGNSSPKSPQAIIKSMAERSRPLARALRSGRPVVVDFSATWCPDCLKLAPVLSDLEKEFRGSVEFVTLDLSFAAPVPLPGPPVKPDPESAYWAQEFRVDGIPHLAFVGADGQVRTALVGNVPAEILHAELEALGQGKTLPFVMYDAFKDGRRLSLPPA